MVIIEEELVMEMIMQVVIKVKNNKIKEIKEEDKKEQAVIKILIIINNKICKNNLVKML